MNQARFLGLLARIQERAGNLEAAMSTLGEVKSLRSRVLKRVQVEQPDAVLEQRHLAAAACHQMAEHAVLQRNYAAAISHYKGVN
jgi:tetratricopeptide repeat protein 21B